MIVAFRTGHRDDARDAYLRYKARLEQELGAEPAPALRDLYYGVSGGPEALVERAEAVIRERVGELARAAAAEAPPQPQAPAGQETVPAGEGRQDVAAGQGAAAVLPVAGPPPAVPRQLPPRPADFTGRVDLVAEAGWLLDRRRAGDAPGPPVIVIFGPGGMGKTALALQVAHRSAGHYPDGQLYIDLGGTTAAPMDPGEVLAQFLRAFGVSPVPESRTERSAALRSLLAGRRVLIVLDDAASGAQIRALIPAHAACGVLVTARQRLADLETGSHHLPPLVPLDRATARELFVRLVRGFGIDVSGELAAVDEVVDLCGGLPLALRIAASLRVHHDPQPTGELVRWLRRHGLDGFEYGEQSLARTIGAGLERLDDGARQLFAELGLIRLRTFAPWTAAAVLARPEPDPSRALSELAARGLLEPAGPGPRFRFHELTREYASRLASQQGTGQDRRQAAVTRVYRALLTLTRQAHATLYGGDFEVVHSGEPDWDGPGAGGAPAAVLEAVQEDPRGWFEGERENLRAAVTHCAELGLTGLCWDLAFSAHELYTLGGYFDDWYATSRAALVACRAAGDVRGEAVMLVSLGQPALVASRRAQQVSGRAELERAAALLGEAGDRHGQAIALRTLASALRRRGHLAEPLRLFTQAQAGYQSAGDTVGEWQVRRLIGQAYLDRGEHGEALTELRAAQRLAEDLTDERLRAQSGYWAGVACLAAGDTAGARPAFAEVLEIYPEPPGVGHAYALHGQAELAHVTGAAAQAAGWLATAAEQARLGRDAVLEGRVHLSLARLHEAAGLAAARARALEQAADCFAGGAPGLELQALNALVAALAPNGDQPAVRRARARAAAVYDAMGLPEEDRGSCPPPASGP
jgi:tetratricopeptide (TPR) repeat protein